MKYEIWYFLNEQTQERSTGFSGPQSNRSSQRNEESSGTECKMSFEDKF